jgi:RimJ/RimL family protein N-acetyltransferase
MRLETDRLILRLIEKSDAPALFPLINDPDVARNLKTVPHPYPENELVPWIRKARIAARKKERFEMAIVLKETGLPVGACSLLHISWEHLRSEIGYWIGKPYWGQGYMTEAVTKMLDFGFADLGLESIHAYCFIRNPASIRVLEKAGFTHEGYIRHAIRKDGEFLDVRLLGMIREDYLSRK